MLFIFWTAFTRILPDCWFLSVARMPDVMTGLHGIASMFPIEPLIRIASHGDGWNHTVASLHLTGSRYFTESHLAEPVALRLPNLFTSPCRMKLSHRIMLSSRILSHWILFSDNVSAPVRRTQMFLGRDMSTGHLQGRQRVWGATMAARNRSLNRKK